MRDDGNATGRTPRFIDDRHLRVGDVDFHCAYPLVRVPPGRIPVVKRRDLVQGYLDVVGELQPRHIVELGVHHGGSTVLLAEVAQPERLVAVELATDKGEALRRYLDEASSGAVRAYFGVDQADGERLGRIIDDEFGTTPLDLVIDDASHLYEESRASFETLFPRLRTGGVYVLEDWCWQHPLAHALTEVDDADAERPVPLSRLVIELILARAGSDSLVDELTIDANWVVIRKGSAACPEPFTVASLYHDHFGQAGPDQPTPLSALIPPDPAP